ncbi:phospholipase A and acyltransferase 4-like [Genypterus blacodes]|uniref:phospholipase A and acyltransferase 4-like n=1 Tax=Genypterus blacodes TaxID=154954 RepID=UPI003F76BA80
MAPILFDEEPKPGDLIEIFRGAYQHWAVYIGNNEVVHMIPAGDDSGILGNLLTMAESSTARVWLQKIWDVVGCHRFHVNNLLDDEYQPRQRHIIVQDACSMVGKELPYCVISRNCEHFVTGLRYGRPNSRQVQDVAVAVGGGAVVAVAAAALGAVLFSSLLKGDKKRYDSDD